MLIPFIGCTSVNLDVIENVCYDDLPDSQNMVLLFTGYSAYGDYRIEESALKALKNRKIKNAIVSGNYKVYSLYVDERMPCGLSTKGKSNTDALFKLTRSNAVPTYIVFREGEFIKSFGFRFSSAEFIESIQK